jgi:hypothetical protein
MAALQRPLTHQEAARADELLTFYKWHLPIHAAILAATDAELPGVVEQILSSHDKATGTLGIAGKA